MQCLQFRFKFPLGSGDGSILCREFIKLFMSITQFLFSLATAAVSLFKELTRFFQFVLKSISSSFRNTQKFTSIIAGSLFFFKCSLDILKLLLVPLDVLLSFSICLKNNNLFSFIL